MIVPNALRLLILSLCLSTALFGPETRAEEPKLAPAVVDFLQQQQQPLPFVVSFEQQRTIQGLPRPLLSSGRLTIAADEVIWHTQQPLEEKLVINATGIHSNEQSKLRGSEVIAKLLLAVLQGDASAIGDNFTTKLQGTCLILTPKLQQLQQFVASIESCGVTAIETIRLVEQQGNQSMIIFQPEAEVGVEAQ
ncbi:outer membrane lipoprotein carrier protein LolA [Pseudidiomarina sp.]|uniref:outer membrane lipoprotein carrier protein LolA n=1 Tax=Pseudidiomarina sp. TaxID=2081707 RepID=UPI003A97550F